MTNEKIILDESFRLMKEGVLKGSGIFVTMEFADGKSEEVELPEEIHTFNGWKTRGYSVKRGEKSAIKFPIWKYAAGKKRAESAEKSENGENGEQEDNSRMFMKNSAFFTKSQVEKIKS